MDSSPALCKQVITLMQRVPPSTVVDSPPTEQSLGTLLEAKFHVPFLALLARLVPPVYITVVAALL